MALTCLLLLLTGLLPLYAQTATQWDKTLGGNSDDYLQAMQQTSDGGYILGGHTISGSGGDITQASKGYWDYWVVKLQADGSKVWDKRMGGSTYDHLTALQQTSDGGYILGGYSNSGASGQKTQGTNGGYDYWVLKLTANGTKSWDKTFGGSGADNLASLRQTPDGGYILGGNSNSGISGEKTQAPKGAGDFWVLKINAQGVKTWDKTFGGPAEDGLTALQLSPDGGYLLGGASSSFIGGDKTEAPKGSNDFWMVKTDAAGNKTWDKTIGGDASDNLKALQPTWDGGFVLGGSSASGISGDKTQAHRGGGDYWIIKLEKVNMAPVAMAQNLTTTQDVPLSIQLSGTDAEDQVLSFHSVQGPSHGTLSGTALDLVYTPAPGYQGEDAFSYAASDGQFTSPPATVAITVAPPPLSYRLNAGGTQVSAAPGIFAADNHFAPAPGFTYSSATLIAGTEDDALYQSERSSPVDNGSFGYNLPLANGKYSVALHFAELYWNAPGQRVFDVALEGALALDNYDIIKKTGVKNTATTETFLVTVTDGMLNINLDAGAEVGGVNRPKISALEVLPYTGAYSFPVAKAGPDRTITLPEENLILDGRGTETHGRVDLFTWTQVSGPNKATFYPYTSAPSVTGLLPGTYVFSLTLVDDQEAVGAPDQMTLTVLPDPNAPQVLPTHRLNAGGPQVTASPGVFSADNYFSNGAGNAYNPTTYATTNPIAGTQDDPLYQTERSSQDDNGSFSYNLPLASGTYTVVLHFAEIYWQNPGQRVFDVALEGSLVLDNYDIVKKTGAGFTATTESFVVNVTDGTLNLLFSALASAGGVNRPKISAIEVIPYSGNPLARKAVSGTTPAGQLKASLDLSAYPNPFRQEINLKMEGAPDGAYTLRVLDLTGKSHYQTSFKLDPAAGTVQTLQLTNQLLPSGGLYLLEVNQVDGPLRKVIRMIKE